MHKALTTLGKSKTMPFIALLLMAFIYTGAVNAQHDTTAPAPAHVPTLSEELAQPFHTEPVTQEIHIDEVHGDHGKKAGLPQFDLATAPSQIFWLLVMFVVLYVFFSRKTLPALSATIESRRAIIRNDITTAEKLSADVEATKTEYETAMEKAKSDARQAVLAVENAARDAAESQNNVFKEKSAATIADFETKAEAEKSRIMGELENVAAEVAAEIVTSLTGIKADDGKIAEAVKARLADTSQTTTKKKAA